MNQMSFWHILAHFIDRLIPDETVDFQYFVFRVSVENLFRTKSWLERCRRLDGVS